MEMPDAIFANFRKFLKKFNNGLPNVIPVMVDEKSYTVNEQIVVVFIFERIKILTASIRKVAILK